LCKDDFISYLAKQNVGNAKKIFKITKMEGILTAYKLFYVGCSRARKNLIVVVDAYKVNGFKEAFMNKKKLRINRSAVTRITGNEFAVICFLYFANSRI
jgi:DNA helicase II / ATP-dependent DNA helicase PcrA